MIEDITGFIDQLVDLFPTVQEDLKALCRTELSTISTTQDLVLLDDVACKDDKILAAEVEKEIDSRGHTFNDWKASGNSKMWAEDDNAFGVQSKGHTYTKFELSDEAYVHLGNRNRGK